jgi:hypothetical protein
VTDQPTLLTTSSATQRPSLVASPLQSTQRLSPYRQPKSAVVLLPKKLSEEKYFDKCAIAHTGGILLS